MTGPIESAAACPKCHQQWHWKSDAPFGLGIYRPIHPPGPCLPRVVLYVPDDAPDTRDERPQAVASCAGCGEPFTKKRCSQLFCAPACREMHVERKRPKKFRCTICSVEFKSTRDGRVTCSKPCRMEYRRRHSALYSLSREVRAYKQNRRAA